MVFMTNTVSKGVFPITCWMWLYEINLAVYCVHHADISEGLQGQLINFIACKSGVIIGSNFHLIIMEIEMHAYIDSYI